jgi:hypothetical protein
VSAITDGVTVTNLATLKQKLRAPMLAEIPRMEPPDPALTSITLPSLA